MSNAAMIFAALCAKAADVAVADKITDSPFANLPVLPSNAVAAVCAKSRTFHVTEEASQTKSCANDKNTTCSSTKSSHTRTTESLSHNDSSRHSRARSSNDIDDYGHDAARERTVLHRYLSEPPSHVYDHPVSSSRHKRITALHNYEDPAAGTGHLTDSCRKSRRSLIDDGHHSGDDESVQMDVNDFLAMAKQMVIAPSGGAEQVFDLPLTTITRQKSNSSSCDMSTTSSISDPDSRRDSVEDLVSSLDSDNLIEALCKKAQTDSALARKLATAAKKLAPREGKEASADDAVDEVIARLFTRLAAVDPSTSESGSRGSRKSVPNKNKNKAAADTTGEKVPQRPAATGGKRRKPRKGKGQRQNAGDTDQSGDDDLSPKTATLSVLDGPSLINALAPQEIPSDEDLNKVGWFKAVDATTGRYYFYTADRSNVSWENPLTSSALSTGTRTTVPLNDRDDPFLADPFADDEFEEADDCFQVVYKRNESGRNVLAR